MTNVTRLPKPFRPHLVTRSEAFAALEISNAVQIQVSEEREEQKRRINSGAPVVVAIEWERGR